MRIRHSAPILLIILSTSCRTFHSDTGSPSSLTTSQAAAVSDAVRAFASVVASEVSRRGPVAWRSCFADSSAFFMAAEGRVVFANSDAATRGIQELTHTIAHIELRWGEGLRVDPLTPTLALLGAPYYELRVDAAGHRVEETGYFTGLAELGPEGWKFRNAHWSVRGPAPAVP